ncbi:hypothetical protein INS49_000735 [Diaporthe citri]|uniref:uncharacterized protein n=1 Tax=Diaporthe citri TaxID=83186 RepID=UPI001C807B06|nr:uncharacterized protein INS49_000735 [Diaporthe citri]KAG6366557.1 hypothetical protein INS49_000735 [Diaporthe citri]
MTLHDLFLIMLPYFPTVPSTPEPEGWDAADVLQLVNPITGKWSCPTVTKRNRRCENVVSQQRSMKVTFMLDTMSVEDAGVIARDHNRELTDLAETMLCPLHSRDAESREKVKGVVAQWKNHIKTSLRQQAQLRPLNVNTKAPTVDYQPTDGQRGRRYDALPEPTAAVPRVQPRIQKTALDVSPVAQDAPPSYGATFDQAALGDLMRTFQSLTLQNHQLRDQNKKLREQKDSLVEKRDAAAREYKRARGELETVEKERDALDEQVEEQFKEINTLRDREAEQLERISTLQDTLQKTSSAYRRLKQI